MNDTTQPEIIEGEIIDKPETEQEIRNTIQDARALIPAGPTGVTPANFAQMVDFAKTMAMAVNAIPSHLRRNAGDCLAIIDIASKVGLSPYMVANKTYVQSGRLAFESQLFHAFAQASGLMRGDFSVKYKGEGDELVCVVSAYIKGDPELKVHESPPLKDVRPKRNDTGVVKGSPLWDKKPRVQLFYDTSRDWVRIFCPRATLGIYTPEEMQEYPISDTPIENTSDLKDRLSLADRSEGNKPGHVDAELANIAGNTNRAPEKEPEKMLDKTNKKAKPKAKKKDKPAPAVVEQTPAVPEEITEPKTAAQYMIYADAWIEKAKNRDDAAARWDGEYDMRAELTVPIKDRNALLSKIDAKFGAQ